MFLKKYVSIPLISIFIIFICGLFSLIYIFDSIKVSKFDTSKIILNKDNIDYFIDQFTETSNTIFIRGWIVEKNIVTKNIKYNILCQNIDSGNVYVIKTFIEQRNDVTNAINDTCNYDLSGFNGKIIKFMLPEKGKYKLMVLFQHNDKDFIIELPYIFYKK